MDQLNALLLAGGSGNASSQFQGCAGPSQAALLGFLSQQQQQQQQYQQQQQQQQGTDGSGTSASDCNTSSLIQALLQHQQQQQLQRQREEQEKALLLQKLRELANPTNQASPDELALLLLQQKQQMQNPVFGLLPSSNPLLSGNISTKLASASPANNLDAATLAKLLQAQQGGASPVPGLPSTVTPTAPTLPQGLEAAAAAGLSSQSGDRRRKGRTGTFPQKLHQMLSDLERQEGGAEIASFLPHGRAFAIHKPREFVKHVMPKYFRMSRFSSFQRQLNLYDFQRITEGPDKGSYYHELFVQGRPILSTMMKRNKIKGVKNKNNNNTADGSSANANFEDGHEEDEEEDM